MHGTTRNLTGLKLSNCNVLIIKIPVFIVATYRIVTTHVPILCIIRIVTRQDNYLPRMWIHNIINAVLQSCQNLWQIATEEWLYGILPKIDLRGDFFWGMLSNGQSLYNWLIVMWTRITSIPEEMTTTFVVWSTELDKVVMACMRHMLYARICAVQRESGWLILSHWTFFILQQWSVSAIWHGSPTCNRNKPHFTLVLWIHLIMNTSN